MGVMQRRGRYHNQTCCAAGFQTSLCRLGVNSGGYLIAIMESGSPSISRHADSRVLPVLAAHRYPRRQGCHRDDDAPTMSVPDTLLHALDFDQALTTLFDLATHDRAARFMRSPPFTPSMSP